MNEDEQYAKETADEKAELGIVDEPKAEEVVVVEPKEEKETPEEKTEEPKPAPIKEDEEEEEDKKPFNFKEYKKTLREELQKDFDAKLEKLREENGKKAPEEKTTDDLEADIEALSKELDFDKDKTRKLIEVARKGLEMSPADKEMLETLKARDEEREQQDIFNSEWSSLTKTLKAQFPNATDEQIQVAKEQMEELAFTENYHEKELDYVLFKEKAIFDKILFSPKQKTFETGRVHETHETEILSATAENIADMNPAQFDAWEKKREAQLSTGEREKVRVTSRDDRGRIVERYE